MLLLLSTAYLAEKQHLSFICLTRQGLELQNTYDIYIRIRTMDYLFSSFNSIGDKMLSRLVSSAIRSWNRFRDQSNPRCESRSWRGLLDTTLCNKVNKWQAVWRWFSPGTTVSTTNKTGRHEITEIWFDVALDFITQLWPYSLINCFFPWYSWTMSKSALDNIHSLQFMHLVGTAGDKRKRNHNSKFKLLLLAL